MVMFILRYRFRQLGLEDEYEVSSAALEASTEGFDMDSYAKDELDKNHIPYGLHSAHLITDEEFLNADYVLYMEDYHLFELRMMMSDDFTCKIVKLSEYSGNEEEIMDPNYTCDFKTAFEQINDGIDGFIRKELHIK